MVGGYALGHLLDAAHAGWFSLAEGAKRHSVLATLGSKTNDTRQLLQVLSPQMVISRFLSWAYLRILVP